MKKIKIIYLKGVANLEELKKLFKKLALDFHPDRGGDTAKMQQLNNEYEYLLKTGEFGEIEDIEFNLIFPELIAVLLNLEGLIIEIVGQWLWVSGNTREHRKKLKELGLFYAPKKQMWYFRKPEHQKIFNKSKPLPMEVIRAVYGSNKVDKDNFKEKEKKQFTAIH